MRGNFGYNLTKRIHVVGGVAMARGWDGGRGETSALRPSPPLALLLLPGILHSARMRGDAVSFDFGVALSRGAPRLTKHGNTGVSTAPGELRDLTIWQRVGGGGDGGF